MRKTSLIKGHEMPILGKLVELYRTQGIEICTGLGAHDFNGLPSAPFTRFVKNGRNMTGGLGIALQEIYLLENLFADYKPHHVFTIGNSLGWSTLALGLLLPDSRVVAMDAGFDENSLHGLDLTNSMAVQAGLPVRAVKGVSPQDVPLVIDAELEGRVDFAFIDGLHTNEQIVLDYEAVAAKAAPGAVYLFHDVHLFDLYEGIARIETLAGRKAQRLRATPSGMVILFDPARHPELAKAVMPFAPSAEAVASIEKEAWKFKHRHIGRFGRSIIKRVGKLRWRA
jgi:predicted O-methyltransferase YrrM